MNEYLDLINQNLIYIYSPVILVSIYKHQSVNSFVLTTILAMIFHQLLVSVDSALWPLVIETSESGNVAVARHMWYGTWVLFDLIAITVIYKSHAKLNISTSRYSEALGFAYFCMLSLQVIRHVDSFYIGSTFIFDLYQYGIPSINIGIIAFLAWNLRGKPENDHGVVKLHND